MPRCQDLAIFVVTTITTIMQTDYFTLAHARGVKIDIKALAYSPELALEKKREKRLTVCYILTYLI